jgi:hypothetical protein
VQVFAQEHLVVAFNGGVPALLQCWYTYTIYIAKASGGLGNVFSDNVYTDPAVAPEPGISWAATWAPVPLGPPGPPPTVRTPGASLSHE